MFVRKISGFYAIFLVFCIIYFSGCISLKERTKGLLGVSTREIESSRDLALKKDFAIGLDECYTKARDILKEIGCYIYTSDKAKGLIAFYVSRSNTTVVGLFLTKIDEANTRLEVSSPSSYSRDIIANKLFSRLESALAPVNEEAVENAGQ